MTQFNWDKVQYREDGKVLLLWRHERIFEEGLVQPGMNCCDIGGWGHLTDRLRQEGCVATIWDNFTDEQYFWERVTEQSFRIVDISDENSVTGYKHSFDLVTCFEVLEHVGDYNRQWRAFVNMGNILKVGGWLAGTFPIPNGTHPIDDPTISSWLDMDEIKFIMQANDFINVTVEPTGSIDRIDTPVSYYFKGQAI